MILGIKIAVWRRRYNKEIILNLYTQDQVSEILKISTKTLEAMRQKGTGPLFKKAGRRVLYDETDIKNYLSDRTYKSTSEY